MSTSKENFVWLSFELGVQGDYESLYVWLDTHKAKECGDSLACFTYLCEGDLYESLKSELSKTIKVSPKTRMYVIRLRQGKMKGKFIFGNRKNAPWTGFAGQESSEDSSND